MIGAISQACSLPVTTAVTCPLSRTHPAIVAQAAATSALLTQGRFTLGVGTGEALNEHITGEAWPSADKRLAMLDEAVHLIRELLTGRQISHTGDHYTIEPHGCPRCRTCRRQSSCPASVRRRSSWPRIADGYMCVQPNADFVRLYRESGGGKRTMQGGLKVFWGPDEAGARKTMHRLWSNEAIPGEAAPLLPLRGHPLLMVPGQCSAASPRAASSARPGRPAR